MRKTILTGLILFTVIFNSSTQQFYEGESYKRQHEVSDAKVVCGIIDTQHDVGGWPQLKSMPAPKDTDHDGMPDKWEDKNNMDKLNPDDRNKVSSDGYTMLEVYLNSIR
ncbi:hypothetical protein [Labilibacter marinus]|uniref:hypothetical protein n=1 Tax=Labilibacter marinus TaxID=1477105 RepID=UPI00117B619B|nr:hypothetical protein [Labilibacter marinus]